jgi:hypothetical protein
LKAVDRFHDLARFLFERAFQEGDILIAVLLAGFAGNQFGAVPRILPQGADVLAGDKAAGNKPDSEQVPDPPGVFGVVLVPLDGFDPFGVCDGDADGILQKVEHGNPILPGRFHTDIPATVLQQPSLEREYLLVERGEPPFLVFRQQPVCGDREFYVVLYYKPFSVFGLGGRPRLRLGFCRDV